MQESSNINRHIRGTGAPFMHSAHEKREGSLVNGSWLPTRQEDECGLDADCAVETSSLFVSSKVLCAALCYETAATLMLIH